MTKQNKVIGSTNMLTYTHTNALLTLVNDPS